MQTCERPRPLLWVNVALLALTTLLSVANAQVGAPRVPCGSVTCHPAAECTDATKGTCACPAPYYVGNGIDCTIDACVALTENGCDACNADPKCNWCQTGFESACLSASFGPSVCTGIGGVLSTTTATCPGANAASCGNILAESCKTCQSSPLGCKTCDGPDGSRICSKSCPTAAGELGAFTEVTTCPLDCTSNTQCTSNQYCILNKCQCLKGLEWDASLKECINPANKCGAVYCDTNGACINGQQCVCDVGFRGDGEVCVFEDTYTAATGSVSTTYKGSREVHVISPDGFDTVKLTFTSIKLESARETIIIYDGSLQGAVLGKFVGPNKNIVKFLSTKPSVVIFFESTSGPVPRAKGAEVGFKVDYEGLKASPAVVCEKVILDAVVPFNESMQAKFGNGLDNAPYTAGDCVEYYLLPTGDFSIIRVFFDYIDMRAGDRLTIFPLDAASVTANVGAAIESFSGLFGQPLEVNSGPNSPGTRGMLIRLKSNPATLPAVIERGFVAQWVATAAESLTPTQAGTVCEERKEVDSAFNGTLRNSETPYQPNQCQEFLISTTNEWRNLEISFLEFDLPHADLSFYEVGGGEITRFTGTTIPDKFTVTGRAVIVAFQSSPNFVTGTGYKLRFRGVDPAPRKCLDHEIFLLDNPRGNISSPAPYNNSQCFQWTIKLDNTYSRVQLNFTQITTADGDLIRVYKGGDVTGELLGEYEGFFDLDEPEDYGHPEEDLYTRAQTENVTIPEGAERDYNLFGTPVIQLDVPGNEVTITFITDESITSFGFHVEYEGFHPAPPERNDKPTGPTINDRNCYTVDLTGDTGVLESADPYHHLQCLQWNIVPKNHHTAIRFDIVYFDTEINNDILSAWSGPNRGGRDIFSLSGLLGRDVNETTFFSKTPNAFVEFISDESYQRKGFKVTWSIVQTSPGGLGAICKHRTTLTDLSGTITTPNFPDSYSAHECVEWLIDVPSVTTFDIRFTFFILDGEGGVEGNQTSTDSDIVYFFDGKDPVPPMKGGKFSDPYVPVFANFTGGVNGTEAPAMFTTPGNAFLVVFRSNAAGNFPGFSFAYSETTSSGCVEHHLTSSIGAIESSPVPYLPSSCTEWLIEVAAGQKVLFNGFSEFDLNRDEFDEFVIYDGPTAQYAVLARYNGRDTPFFNEPIYASTNKVFITFTTDEVDDAPGWKASYGTYITKPAYPEGTRRAGIVCATGWTVQDTTPDVFGDYPSQWQYAETLTVGRQVGFLTSKNPYRDESCHEWHLDSDIFPAIAITALDFELADGDTVTVYDGDTISDPVLAVWQGKGPFPSLITKNSKASMLVIFEADIEARGPGFRLQYSGVDDPVITKSPVGPYNFVEDTAGSIGADWTIADGISGRVLDLLITVTNGKVYEGIGAPVDQLLLRDTLDNLNQRIKAVNYIGNPHYCTAEHGPETVTVRARSLNSNGPANSDNQKVINTIVSCVNDKPLLTVESATHSTSEDIATQLPSIQVSDVDSYDLDMKITLTVRHGVVGIAKSKLGTASVTPTTGTSQSMAGVNPRPASQTLVVTGKSSDINRALDAVNYTPDRHYCNEEQGNEVIDIHLSDLGHSGSGGALTAEASIAVTVICINDAPVITLDQADARGPEDESIALSASVQDFDALDSTQLGCRQSDCTDPWIITHSPDITVTLTVVHGTIAVPAASGLITAPASGESNSLSVYKGGNAATRPVSTNLVITGDLPTINAALGAMTYAPDKNYCQWEHGDETLTIHVTDRGQRGSGGAQTDTKTVPISITCVNDAPYWVLGQTSATEKEDTDIPLSAAIIDVDGLYATFNGVGCRQGECTDPWSRVFEPDLRVTLTVRHGVISVPAIAGVATTPADGKSTSLSKFQNGASPRPAETTLTLVGNVVNINLALANINYRGDRHFCNEEQGPETVTFYVNDLGNHGAGGELTSTQTIPLTITCVNDAPVLTVPDGPYQTIEDLPVVLTGISVQDYDAVASDGPDFGDNVCQQEDCTDAWVLPFHPTVTATVTASVGALTSLASIGISGVPVAPTASLTLKGELHNVNSALGSLEYYPPANECVAKPVISVKISDDGNHGAGGPLEDHGSISVEIACANDVHELVRNIPAITGQEDDTINLSQSILGVPVTGMSSITLADKSVLKQLAGPLFGDQDDAVFPQTGVAKVTVANGILKLGDATSSANDRTVTLSGTFADLVTAFATSFFYTPDANWSGHEAITVEVTLSPSNQVLTARGFVLITPVEDPIIVSISAVTLAEDTDVNLLTTASVSTVDTDSLTKVTIAVEKGTLRLLPSFVTDYPFKARSSVDRRSILLVGSPEGITLGMKSIKYSPDAHYSGDDTVVVKAYHLLSESASTVAGSATAAITVTPVVETPTLSAKTSSDTIKEDTLFTVTVLAASADPSEVVTATITNHANIVKVSPGTAGTASWSIGANGIVTITPQANFCGNLEFEVTATAKEIDGTTASVRESLTVFVECVANAPVLAVTDATTNEDASVSVVITGTLAEPAKEALTLVVAGVPRGASLTPSVSNDEDSTLTVESGVTLTFTPAEHDDTDITLTVTATATCTKHGSDSAKTKQSFTITVAGVADAASLSLSSSSSTAVENARAALPTTTVAFSDEDGSEQAAYSITVTREGGAPLNAEIVGADGKSIGTPTALGVITVDADVFGSALSLISPSTGEFQVTYTVITSEKSGGDSATATKSTTVTITAKAEPAIIGFPSRVDLFLFDNWKHGKGTNEHKHHDKFEKQHAGHYVVGDGTLQESDDVDDHNKAIHGGHGHYNKHKSPAYCELGSDRKKCDSVHSLEAVVGQCQGACASLVSDDDDSSHHPGKGKKIGHGKWGWGHPGNWLCDHKWKGKNKYQVADGECWYLKLPFPIPYSLLPGGGETVDPVTKISGVPSCYYFNHGSRSADSLTTWEIPTSKLGSLELYLVDSFERFTFELTIEITVHQDDQSVTTTKKVELAQNMLTHHEREALAQVEQHVLAEAGIPAPLSITANHYEVWSSGAKFTTTISGLGPAEIICGHALANTQCGSRSGDTVTLAAGDLATNLAIVVPDSYDTKYLGKLRLTVTTSLSGAGSAKHTIDVNVANPTTAMVLTSSPLDVDFNHGRCEHRSAECFCRDHQHDNDDYDDGYLGHDHDDFDNSKYATHTCTYAREFNLEQRATIAAGESRNIRIHGVPRCGFLSNAVLSGSIWRTTSGKLPTVMLSTLSTTPPLVLTTVTENEDGSAAHRAIQLIIPDNSVHQVYSPFTHHFEQAGSEDLPINIAPSILNTLASVTSPSATLIDFTLYGIPVGARLAKVLADGTEVELDAGNSAGAYYYVDRPDILVTDSLAHGLLVYPAPNSDGNLELAVRAYFNDTLKHKQWHSPDDDDDDHHNRRLLSDHDDDDDDDHLERFFVFLTGSVDVAAVADKVTLVADQAIADGYEGDAFTLGLSAHVNDADSEKLGELTIAGVPEGSVITHGTDQGSGVWTVPAAKIGDVEFTGPTHYSGKVTLTHSISAVEARPSGEVPIKTTVTQTFNVIAVANAPELELPESIETKEDTSVSLGATANLVDTDGSEVMTATVTGVPKGAVLTNAVLSAKTGVWTVNNGELSSVKFVPAKHSDADVELIVTVHAIEKSNSATATVSKTLKVIVEAVADTPSLIVKHPGGLKYAEDHSFTLVLTTALTDLDGSESMKLTITETSTDKGVASITAPGCSAGDKAGTWVCDPQNHATLKPVFAPKPDWSGVITLKLTLTATEGANDDTASTEETITITITPVVDPLATFDVALGGDSYEDHAVPLIIDIVTGDIATSETVIKVQISGLPPQAYLSAAPASHGTATLTSLAQLDDLLFIPGPNWSGNVKLTIVCTIQDSVNGPTNSETRILKFTTNGVADRPSGSAPLSVISTVEDTPVIVALAGILDDTDGSESASVRISNVPYGATFSLGRNIGDRVWLVESVDFAKIATIKYTPPADSIGLQCMISTIVATETVGEDTSSLSSPFCVKIVPAVDAVLIRPSRLVGVSTDPDTGRKKASLFLGIAKVGSSETYVADLVGVPLDAVSSVGTRRSDGRRSVYEIDFETSQQPEVTFGEQEDQTPITLEVSVRAAEARNNDHPGLAYTRETIVVDFTKQALPKITGSHKEVLENERIGLEEIIQIASQLSPADATGATLTLYATKAIKLYVNDVEAKSGTEIAISYADVIDANKAIKISQPKDISGHVDINVVLATTDGRESGAPVSIFMHAVAQPPALDVPSKLTVDEDTATPLPVSAVLTGAPDSERLSVLVEGLQAGAKLSAGVHTTNADGTQNVRLSKHDLTDLEIKPAYNYPTGSSNQFTLTWTATAEETSNGHSADTIKTTVVTVAPIADAAILTYPQSLQGVEDVPFNLDLSVHKGDNDGSESVEVLIFGPPGASVVDLSNSNAALPPLTSEVHEGLTLIGTIPEAKLSEAALLSPLHASGSFSIIAIARSTDGTSTKDVVSPLITVQFSAVADKPTILVGSPAADEDTAAPFSVKITSPDKDGSESRSVVFTGIPSGASIALGEDIVAPNADGSITVAAPHGKLTLNYIPAKHSSGAFTMSATAITHDGSTSAASDTVTVHILIHPIADTPVIKAESSYNGKEDQEIPISITASLVDTDGSESLSDALLSFSVPGFKLSAGSGTSETAFTVPASALPTLVAHPPAHFSGPVEVCVKISAVESGSTIPASAKSCFTINVKAIAEVPTITPACSDEILLAIEDVATELPFTYSTEDPSENLNVKFSAQTPSGDAIEIVITYKDKSVGADGHTFVSGIVQDAKFVMSLPANFVGALELTAVANAIDQPSTATASCTTTFNVANVNDVPVATNSHVGAPRTVGTIVSLQASDIDRDTLSYKITALPGSDLRTLVYQVADDGETRGELISAADTAVTNANGLVMVVPIPQNGDNYDNSYRNVKDAGFQDPYGVTSLTFTASDGFLTSNVATVSVSVSRYITPSVENHCDTQVPDPNGQCGCLDNYKRSSGTTQVTRCCAGTQSLDIFRKGKYVRSVTDFKPCIASRMFKWETWETTAISTTTVTGSNELVAYSDAGDLGAAGVVVTYDSSAFDVGEEVTISDADKALVEAANEGSLLYPQSFVFSATTSSGKHWFYPNYVTFCIQDIGTSDQLTTEELCLGYINENNLWQCEDVDIVDAVCDGKKGKKGRTRHFTVFALIEQNRAVTADAQSDEPAAYSSGSSYDAEGTASGFSGSAAWSVPLLIACVVAFTVGAALYVKRRRTNDSTVLPVNCDTPTGERSNEPKWNDIVPSTTLDGSDSENAKSLPATPKLAVKRALPVMNLSQIKRPAPPAPPTPPSPANSPLDSRSSMLPPIRVPSLASRPAPPAPPTPGSKAAVPAPLPTLLPKTPEHE